MKRKQILLIIPIFFLISLACSFPKLSGNVETQTPVPTNTLPSTLTPQSSAIPLSTEVPVQQPPADNPVSDQEVAIVTDNSFSVDEWDYVVGLVQNNTDKTIEWVEISVIFYDENNQIIATETAYPFLDMIVPGDTSPFMVYSDQWAAATTYDFVVNSYDKTDEFPDAGLEILNHTSYSDEYYLNVVGEIRNNSDQPMGWIEVTAALYAADGTLLTANFTYTMLDYIPPGGTSPFKIWFGENWAEGDTYEIQVQGDYDVIPEQVIEVVDYEVSKEDELCTINGNVRNIGSVEVTSTTVVVAFYDAQDNIIETEWNFTEGESIPAGGTDIFEVISYSCPDFDHVQIFVNN